MGGFVQFMSVFWTVLATPPGGDKNGHFLGFLVFFGLLTFFLFFFEDLFKNFHNFMIELIEVGLEVVFEWVVDFWTYWAFRISRPFFRTRL
jgi:hypothetical protein